MWLWIFDRDDPKSNDLAEYNKVTALHRSKKRPAHVRYGFKTGIRLQRSLVSFHRLQTLIGRSGWVKFASPSGRVSLALGPLQEIVPTAPNTDSPTTAGRHHNALLWIAFADVILLLGLAAWHGWS